MTSSKEHNIPSLIFCLCLVTILLGCNGRNATPLPATKQVSPTQPEPTKTSTSTVANSTATDTPLPEPTTTVTPSNPLARLPKRFEDDSGTKMVRVRAGVFLMGSEKGDENRTPVHKVRLDDFYIDQYEVTNEQFVVFLNEKGNQSEEGSTWLEAGNEDVRIHQSGDDWQVDSGYANHPVAEVNWYGARAYCEWRGARLPTEAEWEKAARGDLKQKLYPWGDLHPVCELGAPNGAKFNDRLNCSGYTEPVGSFGANGYDLYDMAGNVAEWVMDWYRGDYYAKSPVDNPQGPDQATYRVVRGGSWTNDSYLPFLQVSYRSALDPTSYNINLFNGIGFRCARSAFPVEEMRPSATSVAPTPLPTLASTPTPYVACEDSYLTRLWVGGSAYVALEPPFPNNVRAGVGKDHDVIGKIQPGEIVEILDGPECANHWTWWQVRALETGLIGWTAEGDAQDYWLIPSIPEGTSSPAVITDDYGISMALVPAGSFQMGSDADEALAECQKHAANDCKPERFQNSEPVHTVTLDDFYIDQYEVTNANYATCVIAGICEPPSDTNSRTRSSYYKYDPYNNYPVIYVTWEDALTYCQWRGARLPTEAEWEKAARGGLEGLLYPWGNDANCSQANFCNDDTSSVGSYAPNGYELYDMSGNVLEWVSDWYNAYPGGDPNGSDKYGMICRVQRGGGFGVFRPITYRNYNIPKRTYGAVGATYDWVGFRCARDTYP